MSAKTQPELAGDSVLTVIDRNQYKRNTWGNQRVYESAGWYTTCPASGKMAYFYASEKFNYL